METIELNKKFKTREEMEKFEKEICEKYIVILVVHGTEENSIESFSHFGKR